MYSVSQYNCGNRGKFREINFLWNEIQTCFHGKMIRNNTMYVHIHMWNLCLPQYERQEIYSHRKNILSNLLFSDFFSKKVAFTEACQK